MAEKKTSEGRGDSSVPADSDSAIPEARTTPLHCFLEWWTLALGNLTALCLTFADCNGSEGNTSMGYDGTITALTAISKTKIGKLGEENNKSPNSRFSDNLKQTTTSCAQDRPKPHATLKQLVSVVSSIVVAIGLRPCFSSSRHQQREKGENGNHSNKKKRNNKTPRNNVVCKEEEGGHVR